GLPEIRALEDLAERALERGRVVLGGVGAKIAFHERERERSQPASQREIEPVRRILRPHDEDERRDIEIRIGAVVISEARVNRRREIDESDLALARLHENVVEVEVAVDTTRMTVELLESGAYGPERAPQRVGRVALERTVADDVTQRRPAVEPLVVDTQLSRVGLEHPRHAQPQRTPGCDPCAERVVERRSKQPFLGQALAESSAAVGRRARHASVHGGHSLRQSQSSHSTLTLPFGPRASMSTRSLSMRRRLVGTG